MKHAAWLKEFAPAKLIPAISAGLIAGILGVILQISFAALIFNGDLSPLLGRGIGLALYSGFVLALVVALTSSFPVSIASPQDSPAAIFAILTLWLSVSLTESRDTFAYYATVSAALAATTLLTGAFFFGLGWFRLGRLVRYIPVSGGRRFSRGHGLAADAGWGECDDGRAVDA